MSMIDALENLFMCFATSLKKIMRMSIPTNNYSLTNTQI